MRRDARRGFDASVYPAANCVPVARGAGATVVIVNAEQTEMDHLADHLLRGRIAKILPNLVATSGVWNSPG